MAQLVRYLPGTQRPDREQAYRPMPMGARPAVPKKAVGPPNLRHETRPAGRDPRPAEATPPRPPGRIRTQVQRGGCQHVLARNTHRRGMATGAPQRPGRGGPPVAKAWSGREVLPAQLNVLDPGRSVAPPLRSAPPPPCRDSHRRSLPPHGVRSRLQRPRPRSPMGSAEPLKVQEVVRPTRGKQYRSGSFAPPHVHQLVRSQVRRRARLQVVVVRSTDIHPRVVRLAL